MAVRQSVLVVGPSATFDLPTQAQNTIVVILSASPTGIGSVTLADNKGNSVVGARKVNYTGGGGISSLTIWVLENITGAGGTHTLSVSGVDQPDFCTLAIAELSLAPGSSYDAAVTATARDTDGSPYTLTTGTPSQDSELVLGVITSEGSTALDYSASGWTRIRQNADFTTYWGQALFTKTAGTTAESFSATATGGSATQLIAAVGIKQIVFPVVQPFEQKTASLGESVTFSPSYTGSPTSYQWRRNGFIISGATSASYTIPVVSAAENGAVYSVTATNSLGTSVEVGSRLFVRDLNTGKGRAARGWAYQRHQLGIVTPLVVQDRDDWGGAAFGDWFSLAAPSFVPRYMPGGGAFDPSVFDPDVFDAPVVAQQLDPIIQVATIIDAAAAPSIGAAQALGGIVQNGTLAAGAVSASAAQTLNGISQAATLRVPGLVSAAQTLGPITQAATFSAPASMPGGAASGVAAAWDPARAGPAIVITGLTVTNSGSHPSPTVQSTAVGSGKRYAEYAVNAINSLLAVGVSNNDVASGELQTDLGQEPGEYGLRNSGYSYFANNYAGYLTGAWAIGDVLMVAMDHATGRIWFGRNGSWFSGDPAANTSPMATAPDSGYRPSVQVGDGDSITAKFTPGSWTYAAPAGFTSYGTLVQPSVDQTLGPITQVGTLAAPSARNASGTQTLGPVAQVATITSPAGLSAAQPLGGITQAATITSSPSVSGAQTLGSVSQVGTFSASHAVAAAQALGSIAQSATLAAGAQVQAAQALSPVSQAATLSARTSVQAAQQLQPLVQSATLGSSMALSAAQVLAGVTQSAALTLPAALSAAQTLAPVVQTGTLQAVLAGAQVSAAQILGGVAQAATLTGSMALQAAQTLAPISQSAALALLARVTAAQALAPVVQSGQLAAVPMGVVGAQTLQPIAQSGALASSMRVIAAQQLADVIQSATMSVSSTLQAVQVLGPVVQVATLVRPGLSSVSAAQALAGIVQTASLRALASLSADQVLGPITQVGLFLPPYVFRESERVFYVPGENRVFLVAGEDRGFRVEPEDREFKVQPEDRAFIVN